MFIHREIMELQLAFGVDGHPARRTQTDSDKDIPGTEIALDGPVSWTVKRPDRTHQLVAGFVPFLLYEAAALKQMVWDHTRLHG